jgi:hypothetical protein
MRSYENGLLSRETLAWIKTGVQIPPSAPQNVFGLYRRHNRCIYSFFSKRLTKKATMRFHQTLTASSFPNPVHLLHTGPYPLTHVVVAQSERSLSATLKELVLDEPDHNLKAYLSGRIVDLPIAFKQAIEPMFERAYFRKAKEEFSFRCVDFARQCGHLPPGMIFCECVKNNFDKEFSEAFGEGVLDSIYDNEESCALCDDNKVLPSRSSWLDILALVDPDWNESAPSFKYSNTPLTIADDDFLFVCTANYYDGAPQIFKTPKGLTVEEICDHHDTDTIKNALFFFVGKEDEARLSVYKDTAEAIITSLQEAKAHTSKDKNENRMKHLIQQEVNYWKVLAVLPEEVAEIQSLVENFERFKK